MLYNSFHPLKNPIEARIKPDPNENVTANLDGLSMIMGKKMKNASINMKTPVPANTPKYTHWLVPGIELRWILGIIKAKIYIISGI